MDKNEIIKLLRKAFQELIEGRKKISEYSARVALIIKEQGLNYKRIDEISKKQDKCDIIISNITKKLLGLKKERDIIEQQIYKEFEKINLHDERMLVYKERSKLLHATWMKNDTSISHLHYKIMKLYEYLKVYRQEKTKLYEKNNSLDKMIEKICYEEYLYMIHCVDDDPEFVVQIFSEGRYFSNLDEDEKKSIRDNYVYMMCTKKRLKGQLNELEKYTMYKQ